MAAIIFLGRLCSLDVDYGLHCYQAYILNFVGKRRHLVMDCISCGFCLSASDDVWVCKFHKLYDEVLLVD